MSSQFQSRETRALRVTRRVSVLAVQAAVLEMALIGGVCAAEATVAELTQPASQVELGIGDVTQSSAKFGEYNGLQKKGGYPIGQFDLRGGGAYDSDSAVRWRLNGTDLGLDTRSLGGEYGEQGRFRITLGYDSIVKQRSDSYRTPYLGAGTGTLTLPSNWETNNRTGCAVNGTASGGPVATPGTAGCGNYYISQATNNANTATPTGNALALTAAELGDFQVLRLKTQREKYDLGLSLNLDTRWSLGASMRHETKDGTQAMGLPFVTTNAQVTVPNPIKYTTNQFNLNLNYAGDQAFADLSYYLSLFNDRIDSVTVQDPYFSSATPSVSAGNITTFPFPDNARYGTAPDNQFHQVNLSGGYRFNPAVNFSGNVSSGRGTQNQAYLPVGTGAWETAPIGIPTQSSLAGKVDYTSAFAKLTFKPINDLNGLVSYKYDERHNQTQSNLYYFRDTDQQIPTTTGAAAGSTVASNGLVGPTVLGGMSPNSALYNLPYSKRTHTGNFDLDYRLGSGQAVKGGYERQHISRWCDNIPAAAADPTTLYVGANGATAAALKVDNCNNSVGSLENTGRLEYRSTLGEYLTGRVSYAHSSRHADAYNTDVAQYAQDILTRFNMTDRERNRARGALSWVASNDVDVTLTVDVIHDHYDLGRNPLDQPPAVALANSTNAVLQLGLQSARTQSATIDASYRATEWLSFNGFYTQEDSRQNLLGNAGTTYAAASSTVALADWGAQMKDRVRSIGLGFKASELGGGKIEITGDYVRVKSSEPYLLSAASGFAFATTATAPTTTLTSAAFASGVTLPSAYNNSDTVKLGLRYAIDKSQSVRFAYAYQRLSSADIATYVGLQPGTATAQVAGSATAKVNGTAVTATNVYAISALMPTYEQAPNYHVQVLGVAYVYTFW
ncbi:MAG: MtrB/PioB family outer membrane beta-barrel protein [Leptothrix sp. (in: b-proteobacteria)]